MESLRRQEEELARERRARARENLAGGDCGLELNGHASADYNGTYRTVDERDGWPVLRNEHGTWLFRIGHLGGLGDGRDSWRLWKNHTWDIDECNSYFTSTDGSLPIGEHEWRVHSGAGRRFLPRTMTMCVVVRS